MSGPLTGMTVIELQGIGPAPFCGMVLSDMGANVIRVDRASNVPDEQPDEPPLDLLARGRTSIGVDLKSADGIEVVLKLVDSADALIEGFRPGVMERLGLGPPIAWPAIPSWCMAA
jgi:alpha-methylacyl-CoA racemase